MGDLEPEASSSPSVTQQIVICSSNSGSRSSSFTNTRDSVDNKGYSSLPSSPSGDSINSHTTSWLALPCSNTYPHFISRSYAVFLHS